MQVGVVGAGAMGRGIAQVAAAAGYEVKIYDVVDSASEAALQKIMKGLSEAVRRGKLTEDQAEAAHRRVSVARELVDLSRAGLVIEAVIEDLAIKQELFATLETIVSAEAILASNTSSLSIGSIAMGMADRSRLIGLHFFNPVPAMRLVEIIVRENTSPTFRQRAEEWVESIGKVGVLSTDSPGFIVNFAGRALTTEALHITQDSVAPISVVDRVAVEVLGFRLGPFQLMDLTGMDVNYPVTANLHEQNFASPNLRSTWRHRYLLETGRLGRKTSSGFYNYPMEQAPETLEFTHEPSRTPTVAVIGSAVLDDLVDATGLIRAEIDDADLILVDPLGEDLVTIAERESLDLLRLVGVDLFIPSPSLYTLMVGPGVDPALVAGLVNSFDGFAPVVVINDSPGFISQRLIAAVVNLACEIAQRGTASPEDIDKAVKLGLGYPDGPLSWADSLGADRILAISDGIHRSTGDPRYRPSPWLRRRVLAGLSCTTTDFIPGTCEDPQTEGA